MKSCRLAICFGILILSPALAWAAGQSDPGSTAAQTPIQYSRLQRFERPFDPVIGYRNAENVVTQSLNEQDLPEFIQNDIENSLKACPGGAASTSDIKVFSYVSDWLRSRGLSPNYVVDFAGLSPNPQCQTPLDCNEDGCMVLAYTSSAYNQWHRELPIRAKGWALDTVNDIRASPIQKLGKPEPLAVFDFTVACVDAPSEDACHDYRFWGLGGLGTYTLPPTTNQQ